MEITTVTYTRRQVLAQYEHHEIVLNSVVRDGDSHVEIINQMIDVATKALEGKLQETTVTAQAKGRVLRQPTDKEIVETLVEKATVVPPVIAKEEAEMPPVIPTEAKKKAAPKKATKPKVTEEMEDVPSPFVAGPIVSGKEVMATEEGAKLKPGENLTPAPAKANKSIVTYDKSIKEHRSRFATYLGTNFKGWQTKKGADEIKTFSANLDGKPLSLIHI